MKKFECLFVLCALLLSLGLVGCGGGVEGKPAIEGTEKPSAEQQKMIDEAKKNMDRQGFGDRTDIPNQD